MGVRTSGFTFHQQQDTVPEIQIRHFIYDLKKIAKWHGLIKLHSVRHMRTLLFLGISKEI